MIIDSYLERRLTEWGEWLRTGNDLGLGYPKQSVLALIADGKTINQNSRSSPKTVSTTDTHENAEEMEKMVVKMAQYRPLMANCLRHYYANP